MAFKKLESNSTAWMFEEMGDLEGEYLDSRQAVSKKGKPITFHEFKTESGEAVSVLGGAVLDRVFATQVQKGQKVRIEFQGEKTGKAGTSYKSYDVSVWED